MAGLCVLLRIMHQESPVSLYPQDEVSLASEHEVFLIQLAQKAEQAISRLKFGLAGGTMWSGLYAFSELYKN